MGEQSVPVTYLCKTISTKRLSFKKAALETMTFYLKLGRDDGSVQLFKEKFQRKLMLRWY